MHVAVADTRRSTAEVAASLAVAEAEEFAEENVKMKKCKNEKIEI